MSRRIYSLGSAPVETRLKHGKRATYTRGKCRCIDCTEANRRYTQEYRERHRATPVEPMTLPGLEP